jgi:hypothetical protein
MTRTMLSFAFLIPLSAAAVGCIPEHDYAGEYEMTYDVVLRYPGTTLGTAREDARAGTANVVVHHGLNSEYLLDLGSSFCRLEGAYIKAEIYSDWPYLDIRPQDCWFTSAGTTHPMSITGTATYDESDSQRFSIVLAGNLLDETRGSATIQFTESW